MLIDTGCFVAALKIPCIKLLQLQSRCLWGDFLELAVGGIVPSQTTLVLSNEFWPAVWIPAHPKERGVLGGWGERLKIFEFSCIQQPAFVCFVLTQL